jgi:hypothetical protein
MVEAHQLPHNDGNNNHDNDNDHEDGEQDDNEDEDEDDEDYTPLSEFEKEEMYREAKELKIIRNEALIPTGRLRDHMSLIDITAAPEFKIKRVPHPGREEYRAIVEIFNGPNMISRHMGLASRVTYRDALSNAAWQAITSYNRSHHDKLKNSIYHLLPQRKKDKFKTSRVKADIPKMVMVHHQDMSAEMSICLHVAQ